jgi:hypothetical protein
MEYYPPPNSARPDGMTAMAIKEPDAMKCNPTTL